MGVANLYKNLMRFRNTDSSPVLSPFSNDTNAPSQHFLIVCMPQIRGIWSVPRFVDTPKIHNVIMRLTAAWLPICLFYWICQACEANEVWLDKNRLTKNQTCPFYGVQFNIRTFQA